jgi:hypothetical protein
MQHTFRAIHRLYGRSVLLKLIEKLSSKVHTGCLTSRANRSALMLGYSAEKWRSSLFIYLGFASSWQKLLYFSLQNGLFPIIDGSVVPWKAIDEFVGNVSGWKKYLYPENNVSGSLRNVGIFLLDYMATYCRSQSPSYTSA